MTSQPRAADAAARIYQRLVATIVRDLKAQAALLDVRPVDVDALRLIAEDESTSPSRLVERMAISTGGLAAILKRLETAGLIARDRGGAGRRRVSITLSDAGRAVMAEELESLARRIGKAASTEAQSEAMRVTLQTLLDVVRDQAAALEAHAAEHAQISADQDAPLRPVVRWG